jgi:hypothetical protein
MEHRARQLCAAHGDIRAAAGRRPRCVLGPLGAAARDAPAAPRVPAGVSPANRDPARRRDLVCALPGDGHDRAARGHQRRASRNGLVLLGGRLLAGTPAFPHTHSRGPGCVVCTIFGFGFVYHDKKKQKKKKKKLTQTAPHPHPGLFFFFFHPPFPPANKNSISLCCSSRCFSLRR